MSDPDETPIDTNPQPYQEQPPATETDARPSRPAGEAGSTPARPENDQAKDMPLEKGGRAGPEPTRYGDWETKGIAVDF